MLVAPNSGDAHMSRGACARRVLLPVRLGLTSPFCTTGGTNYQSGAANPFEELVDDDAAYAQLQREGRDRKKRVKDE